MIDPGEYPKKEIMLSYIHIQSHRVQSDETHTKSYAVLIDLSLLYKATCLRFIGSYKNRVNHCSKGQFFVTGNFHYENSIKSPHIHNLDTEHSCIFCLYVLYKVLGSKRMETEPLKVGTRCFFMQRRSTQHEGASWPAYCRVHRYL